MSDAYTRQLNEDLLRPLLQTSWRFYLLVAFLGAIVAMGLGTWAWQMWNGFGVTGINNPIFWAFYITNFVFWIGISHAGTLISAILRLVNAGWRRPVTRCAEVITAFALMIGALFPIIHLGRPWLFFWLMPYPSSRLIWPNFRSPLVWDFFAITTYLTGSVLFLVLPMIPDFALVRDKTTGWRRRVYGALALGWSGTPKQWHRLESAMSIMAIAIIPVAVSVHTIVSFDFSMAPVPMWHSTMFGPYFVAGAIFSGIAGLIIAMAALRKFLHLEAYLHPLHFQNLGKLLLLMSLLWAYFVFAERLTIWYGNEPSEIVHHPLAPAAAHDHRLRHRVVRRGRRHVARALPDCGAVARPQVPALRLGRLPPAAGRDHDYDFDVRGDDAALRPVLEAGADYLDLGDEGGAASGARVGRGAGARRRVAGDARMSAVYALYPDGDSAQRAVNGLKAAGLSDEAITVIAGEPLEHHEFFETDKSTWMWYIASFGGLVGLTFATWLTRMTELAWPITTGNMPIVAWWPNLIIMFEMTMLFAILAAVLTLLVTAGLPGRRSAIYDPQVMDGKILVGVADPSDAAAVERALAVAGATVIKN
jgi:Ni/Fe-hydrogenase subunit HybB-like protein